MNKAFTLNVRVVDICLNLKSNVTFGIKCIKVMDDKRLFETI